MNTDNLQSSESASVYQQSELQHFFDRLIETKPLVQAPVAPNITGKKVAITGDLVDSRGELIIVSILERLGVKFQVGAAFFHYKTNFDFYLKGRGIIIEYWGMENKPEYEANRRRKENVVKTLGLKLVSIESTEVDNVPMLLQRLKSVLLLTKSTINLAMLEKMN